MARVGSRVRVYDLRFRVLSVEGGMARIGGQMTGTTGQAAGTTPAIENREDQYFWRAGGSE